MFRIIKFYHDKPNIFTICMHFKANNNPHCTINQTIYDINIASHTNPSTNL